MADRRRILLVEIRPKIPQSKVYATWNPLDKSANVTLASGDLAAFAGATTFGAVRATIAMTAGQWYWETAYTTLPTVTYVMAAGVGVASVATLSDGQFGFHSNPILTQSGPRTTPGECYIDGVLVGTVGTVAAGDVICHWYDADSGLYRVRKNGGAWQALGNRPKLSDDGWFPMLQVSRNGRITANFGATAFAFAVPHGVNAGVYSQAAPVATTVYLGSEAFNTLSTDVPASTPYAGRIARDVDLVTSREVSCWVWGGQTRSSRGQLSIVVTDGLLDQWLDWTWRDAEVSIYRGYEGDARAAFTLRSTERVEDAFIDRRRWTLTLADQLAKQDVALPRPLFTTKLANAQLVHTPASIVFGRPLYCEGKLRSTSSLGIDAFTYEFSDAPVRIDAVYDRGDIFATLPTNWAYTQDGLGFKLVNDPDEPVVANPAGPWKASTGTPTINGANGGDFLTWAGSPPVPAGWTQLGTAWVPGNRFQTGTPAGARLAASGTQMVQMYNSGTVLPAGSYLLSFSVTGLVTAGNVCFIAGTAMHYVRIDRVGTFSVLITSTGGNLQFIAGNDGTNPLGAVECTVATMRAQSATLIERLADWIEYLTMTLGGAAAIDTVGIAALQAAANYRLAHYAGAEETLLSIERRTMDGWCGWLVPRRDGTLAIGRVTIPAAVADLTLSERQIKTVTTTNDLAKGLTTRLAGGRNHRVHSDSDLANAVTRAMRAVLKSEYTAIRSAQPTVNVLGNRATFSRKETLSSDVVHADGAPAQPTLLQEPDDLQAEINRVATIWRTPRRFYTIDCVLDASAADTIEPGQTINVIWPRYGLNAGRNLLVIGVTTRFWSRLVTLKVWG